jgi:alpha-tubulin suppressor-like RCC1 family protein
MTDHKHRWHLAGLCWLAAAVVIALAACGGGGDPPTPPATTVTQMIPAATGGTINGPGGVTLVIPPGALATDTPITIALASSGAPPLPAGITAGGPMISLTPSGITFARPLLLSLPVDPVLYPANVTPNFLQTNEAGSGWEQIPATRNGDRVTLATAHFTIYVASGPCSAGCPPPALSITLDQTVAEGGFAFFRVDAAYPTLASDFFGGTYFSYRWLRDGRPAGVINDRTILINPVSLGQAGSYSVEVSVRRVDNDDVIASAVSPAATLAVTVLPPVITGQPRDVEFVVGGSARFISASTSSVAQTLQWKRCDPGTSCPADKSLWMDVNPTVNPTATTPVLVERNLTAADENAQFAMCAFNEPDPRLDPRFPAFRCSDAAVLRLQPTPIAPEILTLSSPGPLLPGDSVSFTVAATGTDLSYQWQRQDAGGTGWTDVNPPVDAATYTISNVVAADAGAIFRVFVSNGAGTDCRAGPGVQPCSTTSPLVIRPGANLALTRVLAGSGFSVALGGDGRIHTWGRGCDGALGKGDLNDGAAPGPIIGLAGVATFGVGRGHVLTLAGTGAAKAWGDNQHGQGAQLAAAIAPSCAGDFPNPNRAVDPAPSDLSAPGLPLLSAVAGADVHSLALSSTGEVLAWGGDGFLALGDGTVNPRRLDRAAVPIGGVLRIAASGYTSAAVTTGGQLWVWGEGGLGDGSTMVRLRPAPVVTAGDVADVALGQQVALVLLRDGRVFTWGRNTGTPVERLTLRQLSLPDIAVGIAARGRHALILLADGRVMAWGENGNGQLGLGHRGTVEVPLQVPGLPPIVAIGTSVNHSLALAADGNVWGWGANSFGQATGNPGADVLSPVQVPGLNLN